MTEKELLESRYYREVISGKKIVHDGDCDIYRCKICTCGLIHLLMILSEETQVLYPKYHEERSEQEWIIEHLMRNPSPKYIPPTKEEIATCTQILKQTIGVDLSQLPLS